MNEHLRAMPPEARQLPPPPEICFGETYSISAGDTLFIIARRFGVTVQDILAANPQITNRDVLFIGQEICIPGDEPQHQPPEAEPSPQPEPEPEPQPAQPPRPQPPKPQPPTGQLRVLTLRFFTETGQPLPREEGSVQLAPRTIVRATFNRPVSRAFFFLEPTGTGTCELARLIGVDCPSATTGVAEILWRVPSGTLGRVFVVACINSVCAKSNEVLVVRD